MGYCLDKEGRTVVARVEMAACMWRRMVGLLGKSGLPEGHGLLLTPGTSVHTFFMRFSLDLIFLTRGWEVRRVVRQVPPGRMVFGGGWIGSVLELQAGWLPEAALRVGDRVALRALGESSGMEPASA